MLTALSPTAALRADLARGARDDPAVGAPERGDDLAAWTIVATVLHRLDALPAAERARNAGRAARAIAARRTAPVTGTPARPTTTALHRTLRRWGDGRATATDVVGAAEAVVEDMERGGALALARSSLVALLATAAGEGAAVHGVALAHLGRVVRQMGELDAAVRLYDASAALAQSVGDGALAARADVGRGVIFWQRGNHPAAREAYARALLHAPAGSPIAAGAHHGLMLVAIGAGELETALQHGWRAFAGAGEEADRRAEALINLGGLCRRLGEHEAALHAFRASLALTTTSRLRLPAICSAALAAAALGRVRLLASFARQADALIAHIGQPYEVARAQLELGEAFGAAGIPGTAAIRYQACEALAEAHGFHELAWRAESARGALATAARTDPAPTAPRDGGAARGAGVREIVHQVRRLPLAAAELLALR